MSPVLPNIHMETLISNQHNYLLKLYKKFLSFFNKIKLQ